MSFIGKTSLQRPCNVEVFDDEHTRLFWQKEIGASVWTKGKAKIELLSWYYLTVDGVDMGAFKTLDEAKEVGKNV